MSSTCFRHLGCAVFLLCMAGCSPRFNWREVAPPSTPLRASMPCKPEIAARTVPLDGGPVEMHLAGCDAGGATFVIGWAPVPAPRLGAVLGAWQDSTLQLAGIPAGPDAPAGRGFVPAGGAALPQSVRLAATGRAPDGTPLPLQAAWFAAVGTEAGGAQALFAAVYRTPEAADASETFFSGLRLR